MLSLTAKGAPSLFVRLTASTLTAVKGAATYGQTTIVQLTAATLIALKGSSGVALATKLAARTQLALKAKSNPTLMASLSAKTLIAVKSSANYGAAPIVQAYKHVVKFIGYVGSFLVR